MYKTTQVLEKLQAGELDEKLEDIYRDSNRVLYQRKRYSDAIRKYEELFSADEICIFSAPGRSEIG